MFNKFRIGLALGLMFAVGSAVAINDSGIATKMRFGATTLTNSTTAPTSGQALCRPTSAATIGGCSVPLSSVTLTAGTGLSGGGDLSTNRTFSIANTVTAGSCTTCVLNYNAQGQITGASSGTSGDTSPAGFGALRTTALAATGITTKAQYFADMFSGIDQTWSVGIGGLNAPAAVVTGVDSEFTFVTTNKLNSNTPWLAAGVKKFYVKFRMKIPGGAVGVASEGLVGFEDPAATQAIAAGFLHGTSSTKYSAIIVGTTTTTLTSTVTVDASYHLHVLQSDGSTVSYSVDGETPVTTAASNLTTTIPLHLHLDSSVTTFTIDWAFWLSESSAAGAGTPAAM